MIFDQIAGKRTRRSKFNLSHEKKMSFNMAELIPSLIQEVVPGDSMKLNSEVLIRMAPMIAPLMHRVNVYQHYFFVPNRLIWDEWEDFITGGRQGDKAPTWPHIAVGNTNKARFAKGKLPDYMGLPVIDGGTTVTQATSITALPFRAYQLIYQEYFQDQNLSDELDIDMSSGQVADTGELDKIMTMRKRAWEKDYFTSALPWAQRGGEAAVPGSPNYSAAAQILESDGSVSLNPSGNGLFQRNDGDITNTSATGDPKGLANLDSVDITINDLRKSARLQEWLERTARGGSRYIEQVLSHFGVRSSDARLQRPEYLGGGKNPVVISEVLNSTGDTGAADPLPQGNMSGHGISVGANNTFKRRFEEHGYVIGLLSVLPKTSYHQGINKMWRRIDKFDYYWPEFAQLGEQEVTNQELYYDPAGTEPQRNQTFGYQSRYAEYKYNQSSVHGDFRDTLNFWHLGRIFDSPPVLNENFIEADPDERIFAVTDPDEDKLYCQIFNNLSAVRPMPYFNKPTL